MPPKNDWVVVTSKNSMRKSKTTKLIEQIPIVVKKKESYSCRSTTLVYCYNNGLFPRGYRNEFMRRPFNILKLPKDLQKMILKRAIRMFDIDISRLYVLRNIYIGWNSWFHNINVMVEFWPPTNFYTTDALLTETKFAPYPVVVEQLVFENRFAEIFFGAYNPRVWKTLPLPTSEQIMTYIGDKGRLEFVQNSLKLGETMFYYLFQMVNLETFPPLNLLHALVWGLRADTRKFSHLSPEFVHWVLSQKWCEKCPSFIESLINARYPLPLLEKFCEFPMEYDWDQFSRKKKRLEDSRMTCYLRAFNQLSFCDDMSECLVWFYRRVPTDKITKWFLYVLNGVDIVNEDDSHSYDPKLLTKSKLASILRIEQIVIDNKDVHPIESIIVYDWYKQFTKSPFNVYNVKAERELWDVQRKLAEEKWAIVKMQKRKKLAHRRRHDYFYDDDDDREQRRLYFRGEDVDSEELNDLISDEEEGL